MELSEEIKELKEYKKNNGLTYRELSEIIDINAVTLNQWILGSVYPTTQSLTKVRNFLNRAKESQQTELLQDKSIDETKSLNNKYYLKLVKGVERWAKDSNLDKQDPYKQYIKIVEEQGKLSEALSGMIYDSDGLNLKISLGYYQVQLIIYCLIRGLKFKEYIEEKFESEISDSKVTADSPHPNPFVVYCTLIATIKVNSNIIKYCKNGNMDKELSQISELLLGLKYIADEYDTSLEKTLEAVYNRIR